MACFYTFEIDFKHYSDSPAAANGHLSNGRRYAAAVTVTVCLVFESVAFPISCLVT